MKITTTISLCHSLKKGHIQPIYSGKRSKCKLQAIKQTTYIADIVPPAIYCYKRMTHAYNIENDIDLIDVVPIFVYNYDALSAPNNENQTKATILHRILRLQQAHMLSKKKCQYHELDGCL